MPHPWRPWALLLLPVWLAGLLSARAEPVTPTGDAPEAGGWRVETVADGLEHPWAIAWLPDGAALVTERPGRVRLIRDGRLKPEPVAVLPETLVLGQGGLLDLALHPDFARTGWVYLTLAIGTPEANRVALARGRWDGARLTEIAILFAVADPKPGGQHFGSRLLWLPDGTLLMSVGDGGNPPTRFGEGLIREQAQRLETHFGKLLRLTADGRPAPDNPFVGQPGARPEIYSYGHRNIQGLAFDAATGRVWATEHGARGGDELNLIRAGANHGWPEVTFSREYWGPAVSGETRRPGIADPVAVWVPSKAPSGLTVYRGDRYPGWDGDLFSGALRGAQVRRIRLDGDRAVGEEKLSIGRRVRDVRQGPDGYLYLLTDEPRGALLRILPEPGAAPVRTGARP